MKTLITSANGSLAYRLKNKLSETDILLGDYCDLPALMVRSGKMLNLPNPFLPAYAHKMLALCLDKSVDKIYLLQEKEWDELKEATTLFNEYGITIFKFGDEI